MADVASPTPAAASPAKKTKAASGIKKAKAAKPAHPITSVMVNKAIADLKERGGSSLQAIKKYISANYKVDADRLAPFIRKYLKNAVESGTLVRTKGKGAAGSFKLDAKPAKGEKKTVAKKPAAKPKASKGIQKKKAAPAAKKAAAKPKKATTVKKAAPAAKKAAAKPKTPTKAKKNAKPPTKKPKSPKPKKAAVSAKSKAIRKTAAKK